MLQNYLCISHHDYSVLPLLLLSAFTIHVLLHSDGEEHMH